MPAAASTPSPWCAPRSRTPTTRTAASRRAGRSGAMTKVGQIAVLGGGPAGGSAALALARGGAAVTLYRPERPGEKPCGGAVPEHVLPRISGFDPAALPAVASPPLRLEDGAGSRVDSALDGIRIFRRQDIAGAIVAAAAVAGARIEPRRVEAVEPCGGLGEGGG